MTRAVPRPTLPATHSPSCRPKVSRMNDPIDQGAAEEHQPELQCRLLDEGAGVADVVDGIDRVDQGADTAGATPDGDPQRDERREYGFALARLDDGALDQRLQQWLQLGRGLLRDELSQRLGHARSGVLVDDGRQRDEHDQHRRHRVEQRIRRLLGKLGRLVTADLLGDLDEHGVAGVLRQQRGMNARGGFLDPRQARPEVRPGLLGARQAVRVAEQTSYGMPDSR